MSKTRWFAVIYGLILAAVTLVGIEVAAGFYAPPWPARALRSSMPPVSGGGLSRVFTGKPWMDTRYNSWGMNDQERSIAKPADVKFRSVFVGDSLVEFTLNPQSVPAAVEQRATAAGVKGFEAVDLGVSGTNPRSYYYRSRDVALSLSPDALLVFFFCGNDFMQNNEAYGSGLLPPLVDESPGGSIVGRIMPSTNWLVVNRLALSEIQRGNAPIPNELETLYDIAHGPPAERVPALVQHMKKYYYPDLSADRLTEIFSRGGDHFWKIFESRPHDEEYLMGWLPNLMVQAEVRQDDMAAIRTPDDAAKVISGEIEATMSWLQAMQDLASTHHVPLRIFIIPTANVSPDFVEFWKPWPRYFSWYVLSEVRRQRLVAALGRTTVPFVDLTPDLQGKSGVYRMTDAHWTEKGVGIAADRVYSELAKIMPH
jgi:hypothetical protein